ncbi:MAG: peptidyl-dipeptidase Dcp [Kiritimatiellia bacterium]|jgi:peptidyl-dipeptidase Dcp
MNGRIGNPLLEIWTGPNGGLPPFGKVQPEHFESALHAAMAEKLVNVERIANNPVAPTFDNTLGALEHCGQLMSRVLAIYGVFRSTMSTSKMQAIESEMAPHLAALRDQINQNGALFARVKAVYDADQSHLNQIQRRLLKKKYRNLVRQGATLNDADKARMAQINQDLARHFTQFSQNLLKDEETFVLLCKDDLQGMPESLVAAAKASAVQIGHPESWAIVNTRSLVDPFLTFSLRRDLRERVWRRFISRGDMGNESDNNGIITEILALRAERAHLLGYKTHAHWRLEDTMAGDPAKGMELMKTVWTPAVARLKQEVIDQQAIADADDITIAPWDFRFYQEQVRKERYDLDQDEVKAYMQLEKLREGMFWVAGQLYGLSFKHLPEVAVVHPDVRVWEVIGRDQQHVGLFYFDPCARPGKRSGAWMVAYRVQERFDGAVTPIVSNNCNFVKGAAGEPVLLSWNDARTLFHEFGHGLHGLLSNVDYPSQAGTAVCRDYVEFPSQIHEHWLGTSEVLSRFAVHYKTGKPIPDHLVERIQRASTFNQGFSTTEFLASGLIDMELHLSEIDRIDPVAFEKQTLADLGMPDELVMRHRTAQFAHIFSSDGYSAGYYSYLWADTLTDDAVDAFIEAGSMYDAETAQRLLECVLSVGDTVDPAEGFRQFRGRDVKVGPLMRQRGFAG